MANADRATVVAGLAKLFKLPPAKAEQLLSGREVVIKKSVSREVADKYRKAFVGIGARVHVEKMGQPATAAVTAARPGPPPRRPSTAANFSWDPEPAESSAASEVETPLEPPRKAHRVEEIKAPSWPVDAPGTVIVEAQPESAPPIEVPDVTIEEVGALIDEAKPVAAPEVDLSTLSMDEPGAVIAEKSAVAAPQFDLSSMAIDESGADLVEKQAVPEPNIDISHLTVEQPPGDDEQQ